MVDDQVGNDYYELHSSHQSSLLARKGVDENRTDNCEYVPTKNESAFRNSKNKW